LVEPFQRRFNGNGRFPENVNSGSRERLSGLRPDTSGNDSRRAFIGNELCRLDTGAAAPVARLVLENIETHIVRVGDDEIRATAKSRIQYRF
jgi:hypothetical protein